MTGTLSGLGSGQQIPLANNFQPGQNSVRPEQNKAEQDNVAKARGTEPASTQNTETGNDNAVRSLSSLSDDPSETKNLRRGSVVDITV